MGEKLLQYYTYIEREAGEDGLEQLVRLTKLPRLHAAGAPDSKEYIRLFKSAVESLTGKAAPDFNGNGRGKYKI